MQSSLALVLVFLLVFAWTPHALPFQMRTNFLQCLSTNHFPVSGNIYTPADASYLPLLQSRIYNVRFASPTTPKPLFIITPSQESDIQATIICSKAYGLRVRVRSGGHDYEGLSYLSFAPFILIDMINLRSVRVNVEKETAWVQSGATLGEVYYKIAEKSQTLAFPAGSCPTVGVGGHFGGGGYGILLRKYGLAVDHVIDARVVTANGTILDRNSMGEDLFWAIRGGGAASFGIVVAWKIKLLPIPPRVAVFNVKRNSTEDIEGLIHRWQYVAPKFPKHITFIVNVNVGSDSKQTIQASFFALLLGGRGELFRLMQEGFPELGLMKEDCVEMSWIQTAVLFAGYPPEGPLEVLLNRTAAGRGSHKVKSDYVTNPMSRAAIQGFFRRLDEKNAQATQIFLIPYGGAMSEISEKAVPFPHRVGNMFKIVYVGNWFDGGDGVTEERISWMREVYRYMTPFVSKSPRRAYINYRDLDLGTNGAVYDGDSVKRASVWGRKYFNNNFERLVRVKTLVDPFNFFKSEQTIPVYGLQLVN